MSRRENLKSVVLRKDQLEFLQELCKENKNATISLLLREAVDVYIESIKAGN